MGQRRGADARFILDGLFFACNRIIVRITPPLIDTSNTEGVAADASLGGVNGILGTVAKLPDITGAEIECTAATFSDDDNPFLKAVGLLPNSFHTLIVFPAGLAAGVKYGPWHVAYAGSEHTMMVPGAQPITLKFETDGVDLATLVCSF